MSNQRCCARLRSNMRSLELWSAIVVMVLTSSAGDVLLSNAMKRIGDLGELRARKGLFAVLGKVFSEKQFHLAIVCMAVAFFSLLAALSWGDASLVAPVSASLTFILTAAFVRVVLLQDCEGPPWRFALIFVV